MNKATFLYDVIKERLDTISSKLAFHKLALAVSGGLDSVALLYLVHEWVKLNKCELHIFTVNHNLRPEAKEECLFVKNLSYSLGHQCHEIEWQHQSSDTYKFSKLQECARQFRYDSMTEKCHELGISNLLTAHHCDDKIETYLMRKSKKTGIFGLSYNENFIYNDIHIFRPLSSIFKQDLKDFLQFNSYEWREDASNSEDKYERNRIRRELVSNYHEDKERLLYEIDQVNIQAIYLNEYLLDFIAEYVYISPLGFATIDHSAFQTQLIDVQIQIMNYLLTIISGHIQVPRFRNLEHILLNLHQIKSTLHGCVIHKQEKKIFIYREYQAICPALLSINKSRIFWDNRFTINTQPHVDYFIRKFNIENDYRECKEQIFNFLGRNFVENIPREILFTLPVFASIKKIIAIPQISYYNDSEFVKNVCVAFAPRFVSRFTHF